MAGDVLVAETPVVKAGAPVDVGAPIRLRRPEHPWVSRGGVKLAGALERFGVDPKDRIAGDIGASTGGFTDCLLRSGALRVYAIDVDTDQLDWRLREDARVRPVAGNARYLEPDWIEDTVDLVTIDVSFISIRKILPAAVRILGEGGEILALVKPQFEVGRGHVGRGGIVRDSRLQQEAVEAVARAGAECGLKYRDSGPAAIPGKRGNQEFFLWFQKP